jgi:adenylosuccinate synthase
MGRPNSKKSGTRTDRDRRTSIWDAVIAATAAGWSATMRLCVLLVVICTALIVAALLNARLLTALPTLFGG